MSCYWGRCIEGHEIKTHFGWRYDRWWKKHDKCFDEAGSFSRPCPKCKAPAQQMCRGRLRIPHVERIAKV